MVAFSVEEYARVLDDVGDLASADVVALLRALEGSTADQVRDALLEALLATIDPYSESSALLAAEAYDLARAENGVRGRYRAQPVAPVDSERVNALARWAVDPLYVPDAGTAAWDAMVSALLGGVQRIVADAARDTTAGNLLADEATGRRFYARVARPGCCAFCSMLASRGAEYDSEASATSVVGRGTAITAGPRRRGGQAKGIRARGSRALGQTFHDYCRCIAVASSPTTRDYLAEQQAQHDRRYLEAVDAVATAREAAGMSTARGDEFMRDVLSVMRMQAGTH